jgi:hypothetical protein
MPAEKIKINRAPVMTLWATVVAEKLGFTHDEALTLGRSVTGLNAQSKGKSLGIFEPGEDKGEKAEEGGERKPGETYFIDLLGRSVPAVNTKDGVRAIDKDKPIQPASVERYLKQKFGDALPEAQAAMQELAKAFDEDELARKAYDLYEKFRPEVPKGVKGWGAAGELSLEKIRALGKGR